MDALCLLAAVAGLSLVGGVCDFRDVECEKAVEFSERAKIACDRTNIFTPLCRNAPDQIRRRFTAVFQRSQAYEENCNPCNQGSGAQCNRGIPSTSNGCLPPDDNRTPPARDDVNASRFIPRFNWHQDEYFEKKQKKRQCCVTTRRTVPFFTPITPNVFPVFCALAGGYQWIDRIVCNIHSESDLEKYGVEQTSRGKCKKECQISWTKRAYAVTNVRPEGWFGHCRFWWLPIWFRYVDVPTHCFCPEFD